MKNFTKFDVFLETGVCVEVPAGTDPETDEGRATIKAAARAAILDVLKSGFDISAERYDPDQDDEVTTTQTRRAEAVNKDIKKLLRSERDGGHGESERRAAAEFVLDSLDADADAAGLAESLAEAATALAEKIRRTAANGETPRAGIPADPSRDELVNFVAGLREAMYGDCDDAGCPTWNPDLSVVGSELIDWAGHEMSRLGLVPSPGPRD